MSKSRSKSKNQTLDHNFGGQMSVTFEEKCLELPFSYPSLGLDTYENPHFKPYTVISLFSGIGGMDLGFLEAGFRIFHASDVDQKTVDTYNLNFKIHKAIAQDIRELNSDSLPRAPTVILGGFPCQGFSSAGKRQIMDPRNSLAWEFIRIIKELRPEFIIGENVLGIRSMQHPDGGLVLDKIKEDLEALGYKIRIELLNAADFGVPQVRKRIFIIGSLHYVPIFPGDLQEQTREPHPRITLKQLLAWIPSDNQPVPLSLSEDTNAYPLQNVYKPFSPSDMQIIRHVPPGENWKSVPYALMTPRLQKMWDNIKKHKSPAFYRRPNLDQVSGTISATMNATHCMALHPVENRRYTVREAACIQSFPINFTFSSNLTQAYREIGNAVPPYLAKQFALVIASQLEGKVVPVLKRSTSPITPLAAVQRNLYQPLK